MVSLPVDNDDFSLETREASPSHLLTKIKSFSLLTRHGISKLKSAEFEAGDYKWKMTVYPDGDEMGKKSNHISVYLSIVGTSSLPVGWEVTAIFNFFIYNHLQDNYLCFRGKAQRFQAINPELRISKFIEKEAFTEPSNGYVFDDNCVFGAEVFVIRNQRLVESVSVFDVKDPYKRKWEISDFSKHENYWNSEEFSAGRYKWKILLYPNGDSRAQGRYVSIFLSWVDSNTFAAHKKVKASCVFCFENRLEGGKNHSQRANFWFNFSCEGYGFPYFISINDMHDKGFLVKDCCILEIQLSVLATQEALN